MLHADKLCSCRSRTCVQLNTQHPSTNDCFLTLYRSITDVCYRKKSRGLWCQVFLLNLLGVVQVKSVLWTFFLQGQGSWHHRSSPDAALIEQGKGLVAMRANRNILFGSSIISCAAAQMLCLYCLLLAIELIQAFAESLACAKPWGWLMLERFLWPETLEQSLS